MLDSGSLDFEESLGLHEVACHLPEFRFAIKHRPKLIIHRHIEISLTIAFIIIFHTMPLLRKGTDGFREESEFFHEEGELSLMRIKELSLHSDEVAEVDKFFGELVGREWFCFTRKLSF